MNPRTLSVLRYVDAFRKANGYAPCLREIKGGCGISSTSVVDYQLRLLECAGLISRTPSVSRTIVLTHAGRALLGNLQRSATMKLRWRNRRA